MYEVGRKPTKSQAYARVICHIAGKERGLSIEVSLSETEIERLADDALRRYPKICDVRFRRMAVGRVRVFQRSCERRLFLIVHRGVSTFEDRLPFSTPIVFCNL